MNSQELKDKIDLLQETAWQLNNRFTRLWKLPAIDEWKLVVASICECLPLLLTPREEERSTLGHFLDILNHFKWQHLQLQDPYQAIVDALNGFSDRHEDWPKVQAYAREETETVNFELHQMAMKARKIGCVIEGTTGETSGQWVVDDEFSLKYSSAFGLTSGDHFFETLLMAEQWVEIGWATGEWKSDELHHEETLSNEYEPIDGQHSIGFARSFPSGTVLGCLLDVTQRSFAFTINGREVPFTESVPFSSNPYYVKAKGDFLYFNFGQVPFKYPPPELATSPAPDLARQANRYALYPKVELMPLVDNQVNPYFTDAKQAKVKATLQQLWTSKELATEEAISAKYTQLWKEESFRKETYNLRWLQAILEMESIASEKINDWASLVERMVTLIADTDWNIQLLDFLLPYSKIRLTAAGETSTAYVTVAILIATILEYKGHSGMFMRISPSFSLFLLSAFLSTADPSTAMFSLIGLGTVKAEQMPELSSTEFTEKLAEWKGKGGNTLKGNHSLAQLHLVLHYFEHSLSSAFATPPATPTSLSPSECSSQAKLSYDGLSLRSDFHWQSAHSYISVNHSFYFPLPVFYFEATLLTSGRMRIGWATQSWQVESGTKLGDSEFSIAYDGATGCIWHQDVQWQVSNATKWKAGDVIGCLLNLANQQLTFYQNGERIQTNGDIYSRVSKAAVFPHTEKTVHVYERNGSLKGETPFIRPYYAALSLGPYQQVTVNFGSTPFRFPPRNHDLRDTAKSRHKHLDVNGVNNAKKLKLDTAQMSNPIETVDGASPITNGDVILENHVTNSNPESSFIILEPTVCQVCKQQTNFRRRTLEGCPHLAFCAECASKNLICKKCPQ